MKIYDMRQVGQKIKEIKPKLKDLLEQYKETPQFIEKIRELLIDCIKEDDLPKAIAIIDWVSGNTFNITGDDLVLIEDKVVPGLSQDGEEVPAISTIAYDMDNRDFGFDLIGYCEDFGLVEKDSIFHSYS